MKNSSKIIMATFLAIAAVVVLDFFKNITLLEKVFAIMFFGLATTLFQSIWNRWTAKPMTAPKIMRGWLLDAELEKNISLVEEGFEELFVDIENIQDDVYRKIIEEDLDEEGTMEIIRCLKNALSLKEGDNNEQKK